ncbi:hypothetical protein JG688_00013810 [Phytophthora aleatoria]|uniref:Uncharacterized protein n=1 Tax=Phytophthora aleatoria TaxID=2496075 RepID=A0A8J5IWL4_9STRA|nr:hypothetical protein JG688_00013810 [Phytophthora aleatoria]
MKPVIRSVGNDMLQHLMKKKNTFFDRPNHVNTMQAHLDLDEPFQFEIKRSIVDDVIGGLLLNLDDIEEEGAKRTSALSEFSAGCDETEYQVDIKSPKLFNLLVGYVSNRASFLAAAAHVCTAQQVMKISYLRGLTDNLCASYIRAVVRQIWIVFIDFSNRVVRFR